MKERSKMPHKTRHGLFLLLRTLLLIALLHSHTLPTESSLRTTDLNTLQFAESYNITCSADSPIRALAISLTHVAIAPGEDIANQRGPADHVLVYPLTPKPPANDAPSKSGSYNPAFFCRRDTPAKITPSKEAQKSGFGAHLAFSDEALYISAPRSIHSHPLNPATMSSSGVVFVYVEKEPGLWEREVVLEPPFPEREKQQQKQGDQEKAARDVSYEDDEENGDNQGEENGSKIDESELHNGSFGHVVAIDRFHQSVWISAPFITRGTGSVYRYLLSAERASPDDTSDQFFAEQYRPTDAQDKRFGSSLVIHAEWAAVGSTNHLYLYHNLRLSQVFPTESEVTGLSFSPWGLVSALTKHVILYSITGGSDRAVQAGLLTIQDSMNDYGALDGVDKYKAIKARKNDPKRNTGLSKNIQFTNVYWEREVLVTCTTDYIIVYHWHPTPKKENGSTHYKPEDLENELVWHYSIGSLNAGRWEPIQRIVPSSGTLSEMRKSALSFGSRIEVVGDKLFALALPQSFFASLKGENMFYARLPKSHYPRPKLEIQKEEAEPVVSFMSTYKFPFFAQGYNGIGSLVFSKEFVVLSRVECGNTTHSGCKSRSIEIYTTSAIASEAAKTQTKDTLIHPVKIITHPNTKRNIHFGNRLLLKDNILFVTSSSTDAADSDGGVVFVYDCLHTELMPFLMPETPSPSKSFTQSARQSSSGSRSASGGENCLSSPESLRSRTYQADEEFGYSLGFHSLYAVVGAPNHLSKTHSKHTGAIFLFRRKTMGEWGRNPIRLIAADLQDGDRFGHSLAVNSDWVIVGNQPFDPHLHAVYIFHMDRGWSLTQKICSNRSVHFGHALSLFGDVLFVGDPSDPHSKHGSGSVHVFSMAPNQNFMRMGRIHPSDPRSGMEFGTQVQWHDSHGSLVVGSESCVKAQCHQNTRFEHVFSMAKDSDAWAWEEAAVLQFPLDAFVVPGYGYEDGHREPHSHGDDADSDSDEDEDDYEDFDF